MREEKKGKWSKETLTQQSRRAATLRLNVLRLSIRRSGHRENDFGEQNHREKEKGKGKASRGIPFTREASVLLDISNWCNSCCACTD